MICHAFFQETFEKPTTSTIQASNFFLNIWINSFYEELYIPRKEVVLNNDHRNHTSHSCSNVIFANKTRHTSQCIMLAICHRINLFNIKYAIHVINLINLTHISHFCMVHVSLAYFAYFKCVYCNSNVIKFSIAIIKMRKISKFSLFNYFIASFCELGTI